MVRRTIENLGSDLAHAELQNEVFHYFAEVDLPRFELGGSQYFFASESLKNTGRARVLIRDDTINHEVAQDYTVMFPKFHGLDRWEAYTPDDTKGYADGTSHDLKSMLFSLVFEK